MKFNTMMFKKQLNNNIQESEGKLSVKRSVSLALLHYVAKSSSDQEGNRIMVRGQLCQTVVIKLVEGTTMPQCSHLQHGYLYLQLPGLPVPMC